MNASFCSTCGQGLATGATSCALCGQNVEQAEVVAAAGSRGGRGTVWLVVASVGVLAAALTAMYVMRPSHHDSTIITTPVATVTSAEPEVRLTDATRQPRTNPARVSIAAGSGGKACTAGEDSGWAGYPGASCTFWQEPSGLGSGKAVTKGQWTVACQADLGRANPVYRAGQENTWWLWVQDQEGSWDWYPQTAIKEGASGRPVDGVAFCVA